MSIFLLAVSGAALAHRYLQVYAPSNVVVAHVRRARPRLCIAVRLLALAATVGSTAFALAQWAVNGAPGWLNLVIIIAVWDAFKFTLMAFAVALRRAGAASVTALRRSSNVHLVASSVASPRFGGRRRGPPPKRRPTTTLPG